MKKSVTLLLLAALCVCLSACSGSSDDKKVITGDVTTTTTNEQAASSTEAVAQEDTSSTAKGYVFSFNGTDVVIDAKADDIIASLGEPASYYEAASCAFNGLDKIYTYASFEVDTYPQDDADFISGVILKDDTVETQEGIYIGQTMQNMIDTYGDGYSDEDGMYVYKKDGMKLCFIVNDDSIVSIKYLSTVLDEE